MAKMNNELTVKDIVNSLEQALNCSQKFIAQCAGVAENTISLNLDKKIKEVATKKTGRRLLGLYEAVHALSSNAVSSVAIHEAISEHVFEDLEGNADSVISALSSDKYPRSVLVNIAKLGLQQYVEKLQARDKVYPAFKETVTALRA
ncbi:hypothetical protein [Bdellovibrio sp. BCCA]|uniref:hypothetical protein n=1 Tax=Bdellovibrio sp. BCCA TaxID=3136281 RepID=UPI0030F33A94